MENTQNPPEEFFSLTEAAQYCHVTRQAIYVAIRKRNLVATKKGRRWNIKRSDMDYYRSNKYNRDRRKIGNELLFDMEKGFFSVLQVCKVISATIGRPYSLQHIYYLLRTGQLKAMKKGSAWVITKEDAIKLLDKAKGETKEQMSFVS